MKKLSRYSILASIALLSLIVIKAYSGGFIFKDLIVDRSYFIDPNIDFSKFEPEGKLKSKINIGSYTIRLYKNELEYIEILKENRRVYGDYSGYFYIGFGNSTCDDDLNQRSLINEDITGNGTPNLVVFGWTGGVHCCYRAFIFELGNKLKRLDVINGEHSQPEFVNMDNDGALEVLVNDWAYQGWPGCFASSPSPKIILKWNGQRYAVATKLMRTIRPSLKRVTQKAIAFSTIPNCSGDKLAEIFIQALELMYSGHEDLGWKFIEMAWPLSCYEYYQKILYEFKDRLQYSRYWFEIKNSS